MSYLLDALKKIEQEKNLGKTPSAASLSNLQTPTARRSGSPSIAIVLIVFNLLVFAGAVLWYLRGDDGGNVPPVVLEDQPATVAQAAVQRVPPPQDRRENDARHSPAVAEPAAPSAVATVVSPNRSPASLIPQGLQGAPVIVVQTQAPPYQAGQPVMQVSVSPAGVAPPAQAQAAPPGITAPPPPPEPTSTYPLRAVKQPTVNEPKATPPTPAPPVVSKAFHTPPLASISESPAPVPSRQSIRPARSIDATPKPTPKPTPRPAALVSPPAATPAQKPPASTESRTEAQEASASIAPEPAAGAFAANAARVFHADVVGIKSGCLIEVKEGSRTHPVRLAGVACPPKGNEHAKAARSFTTRTVFTLPVRVVVWSEDGEGRLVADVHTEDGVFLNAALLKAGLAKATEPGLKPAEKQARQRHAGIWGSGW